MVSNTLSTMMHVSQHAMRHSAQHTEHCGAWCPAHWALLYMVPNTLRDMVLRTLTTMMHGAQHTEHYVTWCLTPWELWGMVPNTLSTMSTKVVNWTKRSPFNTVWGSIVNPRDGYLVGTLSKCFSSQLLKDSVYTTGWCSPGFIPTH